MQPLAERMRPKDLSGFVGQDEVVGKGKLLRRVIDEDQVPSMIFWGPPGTGKTTLANIIANRTQSKFYKISAVTSGLADLKKIIDDAKVDQRFGKKTILFIDEIHRWNKKQQDALLPYIEQGIIILIGATTENPSFEVVGALLSRTKVIVFNKLESLNISKIVNKALRNDIELGRLNLKIKKDALKVLSGLSNGDLRNALNTLEVAAFLAKSKKKKEIEIGEIKEALQKQNVYYDKNGEEHYNIISALHKSMRGSDPDAALYWLARMLEGGEEPLYVARRLIRFASEDIGVANSLALPQAVAAYNACHYIGMPECAVNLAQAVVYMAKSKKSNDLYTAYNKAREDAINFGNLAVPLHIRNAPTKLMENLGYGKDYKYSPNFNYEEKQDYFPSKLRNRKYLK